MRLGIDFGTTRTVVAASDRGNYPIVSFYDAHDDAHEYIPSVVAEHEGALLFGFDALAAATAGATLVRSFKRALGSPRVTADTAIEIGALRVPLLDVLTGFLAHVRGEIVGRSNVPRKKHDSELTAVVAVPAHAHGAQRWLTLEAFRRAGYAVRALMNEPSAAALEYTHRQAKTVSVRRTRVVVYDLGGGTFDASLVRVDGGRHDVLGTAGHNRLGGDDFDEVLAELVVARGGTGAVTPLARAALLDACRDAKERITPQSRRVVLDVGEREVVVAVAEFYERAALLVERTIDIMRPLLGTLGEDSELDEVAGIYTVGGGSGLPLVARVLRERFGRRVHRSPFPAAACAIGLAIAADDDSGFSVSDRLSRTFGVFREQDDGRALSFDALLLPDVPLGGAPLVRRYRAAHNVGHFRFVECASLRDGEPDGDVIPFADVRFAFDGRLRGRDLSEVPVVRTGSGPEIEERYHVDDNGMILVEIEDVAAGFVQSFRITSPR